MRGSFTLKVYIGVYMYIHIYIYMCNIYIYIHLYSDIHMFLGFRDQGFPNIRGTFAGPPS